MAVAGDGYTRGPDEQISWVKSLPFILMHVMPLGIIWTGFGWKEATLAVALYLVRMFFITAGYHRYFAHRAFKTGRVMQFIFAFGGGTAAQKGMLWWSGHHRHHHKHSDTPVDIHSPKRGFWWSHMGWIVCEKYEETPTQSIKDFAKYPELVWLDKHHLVPPVALGLACYLLGGWSALFGGFFLSTAVLYHGTFVINSVTHVFGRRRYATSDTSKNSLLLALITLGEGWHNNHHYYQSTANQGFFWWEIDVSYYVLKVMSWFGLVWDLRTPSKKILQSNLEKPAAPASEPVPVAARVSERPATA
ncbi:MAG: acyl-CoA desaturase [Polyangiaceae bacterium]|nr:acyl-CoA desaturase [Polyangiaceae bacterium]MCE7889644.1 acyl-CoA desaturase [Sorangiineae bacterium PRO1]MCL4751001.1 acyl-CoA desaturase [Myxococcales bacterium]